MEEFLKHLSLNSVAVERRHATKIVDLFAGCGGLAIWKQSTFRIAKKEHPELWEANKNLKDVDELFLPNWEEELRDVQPGKKYSLRIDLNNFYQLIPTRYRTTVDNARSGLLGPVTISN